MHFHNTCHTDTSACRRAFDHPKAIFKRRNGESGNENGEREWGTGNGEWGIFKIGESLKAGIFKMGNL